MAAGCPITEWSDTHGARRTYRRSAALERL